MTAQPGPQKHAEDCNSKQAAAEFSAIDVQDERFGMHQQAAGSSKKLSSLECEVVQNARNSSQPMICVADIMYQSAAIVSGQKLVCCHRKWSLPVRGGTVASNDDT